MIFFQSWPVYLHREGKGSLLLRKNVTLDPRQKDRLQETGHVFVIKVTSTPAIFFILQVKRDGRESPSHPVIENAIFLKD